MAHVPADEAGGVAVLATLDTIKFSELGRALIDGSDEGYNVIVGSRPGRIIRFRDYARHPNVIVELSDTLASTAAGAYQFLFGTWSGLAAEHGYADMGKINQDRGAIELMRGRGALPYIARGDIAQALAACAPIWASLPGAGYGQRENHMTDLRNAIEVARARYT